MVKIILLNIIIVFGWNCFLVNPKSKVTFPNNQTLLSILYASNQQNKNNQTKGNTNFFGSNIKSIEVKVIYQESAVPLTETIFPSNANEITPWDVLEKNLMELFNQRPQKIEIQVPKNLNQMQKIPDSENSWDLGQIKTIIERNANTAVHPEQGKIFIVFLNGNFMENGKINNKVAGINLIGTPYVAIFPSVIHPGGKTKGNLTELFKEQATITHEAGHAIGLVNNGIPLKSQHQDSEKGAHCTNQFCVMYWSNNSSFSIGKFLSEYITKGNLILFHEECLKDIREYELNFLPLLEEVMNSISSTFVE